MPEKKPPNVPAPDGGISWRVDAAGLLREISELEENVRSLDLAFSGLKDIDDIFELILIKLRVARTLLIHPDADDSEARIEEAKKRKKRRTRFVSSAMKKALIKYAQKKDRGPFQWVDWDEVFEIGEGEEEIIESERMTLPLSQAIVLIEDELIPQIDNQLKINPGDDGLQRQQVKLQRQVEIYKTAKFFPRARQILLPPEIRGPYRGRSQP